MVLAKLTRPVLELLGVAFKMSRDQHVETCSKNWKLNYEANFKLGEYFWKKITNPIQIKEFTYLLDNPK